MAMSLAKRSVQAGGDLRDIRDENDTSGLISLGPSTLSSCYMLRPPYKRHALITRKSGTLLELILYSHITHLNTNGHVSCHETTPHLPGP